MAFIPGLGKENWWLKITKMNQIGSKEQGLGQDALMALWIREEQKGPTELVLSCVACRRMAALAP